MLQADLGLFELACAVRANGLRCVSRESWQEGAENGDLSVVLGLFLINFERSGRKLRSTVWGSA